MDQTPPPERSLAGATPTLEAFLATERLALVTRNRGDYFAGIPVAAITVLVLWRTLPTWLLMLWFGLTCGVVLVRACFTSLCNASPPPPQSVHKWLGLFTGFTILAGSLWGVTGIAILLTPNPIIQCAVIILNTGIMAGGTSFSAGYRPSLFGFSVSVTLPVVAALLVRDDNVHIGLALLLTFAAIMLAGGALKVNRVITASIVMRFNQQRLLDQVQATQIAMAEAQHLAQAGSWVHDLKTNIITLSAEACRIYGIDPAAPAPDFNLILARVHPDDKARLDAHRATLDGSIDRPILEHRMIMDDGAIKHLRIIPKLIFDAAGRPVQVTGSVQDVTESRVAAQKLQFANTVLHTQMEASRDGILVVDRAGKIIAVNQRYGEISDTQIDDLVGEDFSLAVDRVSGLMKEPAAFLRRTEVLAINPLESAEAEAEFDLADGRFVRRYMAPMQAPDGSCLGRAWFYSDITESRRAEAAIAYRDNLLQTVTAATAIAVGAPSLEEGVANALAKVGETMGADRIIVFRSEPCAVPMVSARFVWQSALLDRPFQVADPVLQNLDPAELTAWLAPLDAGKPVIAHRATAEGAVLRLLEFQGTHSTLNMPVFIDGVLWGFVAIDVCAAPRDWAASEIEITGILAEITASLVARERDRLAIQARERRFRLLTTAALDTVILSDEAGMILNWNQAAERMLGHSAAEALGRNVIRLLGLEGQRAEIESKLRTMTRDGGLFLELFIRRKDGTEICAELSIAVARIGERLEFITIMRDITERKAAEQKLKFANVLLKTQMEASPEGILVIDPEGKITAINQRFGEIHRTRAGGLLGKHFRVLVESLASHMKDPDEFRRRMAVVAKTPNEDSVDEFEFADGRIVDVHRAPLRAANGDYLGRAVFCADVTERRNAERKLQLANVLLYTQMEASPDGILATDIDGKIIAVSQRYGEVSQTRIDDLLGQHFWTAVQRVSVLVKDQAAFLGTVAAWAGIRDEALTTEFEYANGRIILVYRTPLRTQAGEYLGRAVFCADITERRNAERKLQFANILLKTQMDASHDGILVIDSSDNVVAVNQRYGEISQTRIDDLIGQHVSVAIERASRAMKDPEAFLRRLTAEVLIEPIESFAYQDEFEYADGRFSTGYRTLLYGPNGEILGRAGFYTDVTERRIAEQKLQFANTLLKTQMDASRDSILVIDNMGTIVAVNQRFGEIAGVRIDDLPGQDISAAILRVSANVKDPEAFQRRMTYLVEHIDDESEDAFEMADGRFVTGYQATLRGGNGAYLGRASFYADITDRKRTAEAIAYRDRLLAAATATATIAVGTLETGQDVIDAIAKIGQTMGVDRIMVYRNTRDAARPLVVPFYWESESIQRPYRPEARRPEMDEAALAAWRAPLAQGKPVITQRATAEGAILRSLEHYGAQSSLRMPIFVAGDFWGFLAIHDCAAPREWTESEIETVSILAEVGGTLVLRERARIALATSERRFRMLISAAQDGILLSDENAIILQWNNGAEQITGYGAAEAQGQNVIKLLKMQDYWPEIQRQLRAGDIDSSAFLELIIRRKDGTEIWVDTRISAAKFGERVEYISIMRDISERKTAEQKLQFANIVLNTQMDASRDGIVVLEPDGKIVAVNKRLGEICNMRIDDLPGQNVGVAVARVSTAAKDPAAFLRRMAVLAEDPHQRTDEMFETADGRFITGYRTALYGPNGEVLGRAAFYTDITESKLAAETLAYRDRLLHTVATATAIAVGARSLEEGVPVALAQIGQAMSVDRVLVVQTMPATLPSLAVEFMWQSPAIPTAFQLGAGADLFDPMEMAAWRAPLLEGKPVMGQRETASGALLAMMNHHGIQSCLLMPVSFGRKIWGFISVDACAAPRAWAASEIEILGILAEITSSLVVREYARLALENSERRFRQLTSTARDAVTVTDGAAIIQQWNGAAETMFGYSAAEALGQDLVTLLGQRGQRREIAQTLQAFSEVGATHLELPLRRKDGEGIVTETSLSAADIDGKLEYIAIIRDISERKIAEQELMLSNALLKTQMEASPEGIFVVARDGKILSYNHRFLEMWSLSEAAVQNAPRTFFTDAVAKFMADPEAFKARIAFLNQQIGETADDELETTDGRIIERHSVSLGGPGQDLGRAWFYRDVTARRAADAQALRLARFDPLTGLANRSLFIESLNQAIAHAKRDDTRFAVLYLDLDHFKDVNDTLGHAAGDALLKGVAARLLSATRETDTVARFGGDEFAVILTGIQDEAGAGVLAERLLAELNRPLVIDTNTVIVRASIGIEILSGAAEDSETLLAHADVALYRVKAEGRGTFRFFTDDMDKDVRGRVTLAMELREAITARAFVLLYQPQIEVTTGAVIGVEALLRWPHPTRGMLSAKSFMEAAETTGTINELGRFALWTACRQAVAWRQAGYFLPKISVNISVMQLKTATTLEADVLAALAETGLPPQILELELTESGLARTAGETTNVLRRLEERGVKFAIDHFGTGYSSLDYLRRFPADHIKIPGTFIRNIENEASNASIVRAIIGLATELNVITIAEGVETHAQLNLIARWGCTQMQGYYFCGPVSAEEITEILKSGGIQNRRPGSPSPSSPPELTDD